MACEILLLAIITLLPGRIFAQTSLWQVINTELRDNDSQFLVIFERATIDEHVRNDARIRKILVLIRNDNLLISYQPSDALPFERITFDSAIKEETSKLTALSVDFQKVSAAQKKRSNEGFITSGSDGQRVKKYSGTLGDFDVSYEVETHPWLGNGPYGGYIKLISKDGDNQKYRAIVEPTALEEIIASAATLRKMYQQAIEAKQRQLAAQKSLNQEIAKDQIAAAKAASDERVKKAEESAKAKLAELDKQKELDTIARDESARKSQIDAQLVAQRRAKVALYIDSQGGKVLVKSIQNKLKQVTEKNAEETKDITALEKQQEGFLSIMESRDPLITSEVRQKASQYYYSTTLALGDARTNHRDSTQLTTLRKELGVLLDKFKGECGIGYDDAMAIQAAGNTK